MNEMMLHTDTVAGCNTRDCTCSSDETRRAPCQRHTLALLLRQARMQWRLGNIRPAGALCEQIIDTFPGCRAAHRLALRAARLEHAWDRHAGLIRLPTLIWPSDPRLMLEAAWFHLAHGRLKEARATWLRAGTRLARRSDSLDFEIELLESEGQYRTALALASRRLTKRPHESSLLVKIARVSLSAGRPDIGLRALSQLVHPPRILQARLLASTHQLYQALDCINSLIAEQSASGTEPCAVPHEAGPTSPRTTSAPADYLQARLLRIDWLVALGDLSRIRALAGDWLDQATSTEMDPNRGEEGVALARALMSLGQWSDALRLAHACRHADGIIQLRSRGVMAAVCTQLNRTRLAARCARPLRQTPLGTRILARCHRIAMYGRELANQWTPRSAPQTAGADPETSVLKPLLERSASVLDWAVKSNPAYADLRFHRANCLSGLGRDDTAREELEAALALNPRYRKARELLDSLCGKPNACA